MAVQPAFVTFFVGVIIHGYGNTTCALIHDVLHGIGQVGRGTIFPSARSPLRLFAAGKACVDIIDDRLDVSEALDHVVGACLF